MHLAVAWRDMHSWLQDPSPKVGGPCDVITTQHSRDTTPRSTGPAGRGQGELLAMCLPKPTTFTKTGAPGEIRTHDLCLRRAALYPAELRVPRGLVPRGIDTAVTP